MRIIAITLLAIATTAPLRAEVIDRILATVGGALILQSDAVAAARLGFVELPATGDRLQWTLDRLIERRLMLIEVDRYGPPEPDRAVVDQRMQQIDQRIGSGERLDAILRETGLSVDQLRLYVRDELRIEGYVEQRFAAAFRPSDDDLVAYYRSHEARFTRDGKLRPFAEVRDEARAALVAERRAAAVRDWLAGLRRRTEVNVLYLGR
jgi:parvulin-like peptidyl-prolyl isomerase